MASHGVSRRNFIRLSTGGALAGLASLPLLLEACGGSSAPASSAAPSSSVPSSTVASAKPSASTGAPASASASASSAAPASGAVPVVAPKGVTLPKYVPVQGPPPDMPATGTGVPPAYLSFPKNLIQSVKQAPGKGGDVNVTTYVISGAPPTPLAQNDWWQAINKAVNANIKVDAVAYADYPTRITTILAGGNLPDIFAISVLGSLIPGLPDFLSSQCADLTPFLAGDAITAYPNLANLPTNAWPTAIFNKKILTVPQVDNNGGPDLLANGKQLAAVGASPTAFKNTDDFTKVAKQLTQAGKQWAIGSNILTFIMEVFRVPNDWRNDGGKLTKDIETPEYKDAVAYLRSLWDAGVIWPDTPTSSVNTLAQGFYAGRYAFWPNLFLAFTGAYDSTLQQDPNFDLHIMTPFGHDGGKGVQYLGTGSIGLTALKKASDDRIKEMLGILDYLAAPFGSQEQLLVGYGVKDTDYALDASGNPKPTKQGQSDLLPWAGLVRRPPVFYDPTNPQAAKVGYQDESAAVAEGILSPTIGLYSNTYAQKGATLNRALTDGLNQILYGRQPVTALDDLIKNWRSNGGDQIRSEFQQALQDSTK